MQRDVDVWITTWDARAAFPSEFDVEGDTPAALDEIIVKLGGVVATDGKAIVLPGPEPWQAVVVTMTGREDGHVAGALVPAERAGE